MKKPAVGRAVLSVIFSFLICGVGYAFKGPVGSSGLTELTQPQVIPDSSQSPDEGSSSIMIPVSMQTPPDTSQAVPYDDGLGLESTYVV